MKKEIFKIDKNLFRLLFATLRKLELSIHRRRSLNEIYTYIDNCTNEINKILQDLRTLDNFQDVNINNIQVSSVQDRSCLRKTLNRFFWKYRLKKNEVELLMILLEETKKIPLLRMDENSLLILRIKLRAFYENILGMRMPLNERRKLSSIEHLNSNARSSYLSLQDLITKT